jgi:hypothetical protein
MDIGCLIDAPLSRSNCALTQILGRVMLFVCDVEGVRKVLMRNGYVVAVVLSACVRAVRRVAVPGPRTSLRHTCFPFADRESL